jgi:hypothetical protein
MLMRWRLYRREGDAPLRLRIVYFGPERRDAAMEIGSQGSVKYYSSDQEVPFYPYPLRFVFLKQYIIRSYTDELGLVSRILDIDESTVGNLLPIVNRRGEGSVRNLRLHQSEEGVRLCADMETRDGSTQKDTHFTSLSDSEQARVLIELAIAMARFSAEYIPTMLLLEGAILSLDPTWLGRYSSFLLAPEQLFQTVVVLPNAPTAKHRPHWAGWEFVRLNGSKRGVTIDQNPF